MIRRVIEYVITCDANGQCVADPMIGYSTAFGSRTMDECIKDAEKDGWKRVSPRLWLCPQCKEKIEEQAKVV